jgi:hypothetical protein
MALAALISAPARTNNSGSTPGAKDDPFKPLIEGAAPSCWPLIPQKTDHAAASYEDGRPSEARRKLRGSDERHISRH